MKVINAIQAYDIFVFMWIAESKFRKYLIQIARCISKTGDGYLYGLLLIYLALLGNVQETGLMYTLLVAFAMERPTYFLIKNVSKRDRPQAALNIPGFVVPSDRFSFPSGHTSAAFLVATLLADFNPIVSVPILVWAGLIGASRVILGVHFPTDTLIGAFMGSTLAILSMEIVLK